MSSIIKIREVLSDSEKEEEKSFSLFFDFSLLSHTKYGFQNIINKAQSKAFTEYIMKCKNDDNVLSKTVRSKRYENDFIRPEQANKIENGARFIGMQIEHFCVTYEFRLHGFRDGKVFYVIRIDPEHRFMGQD
jgi:hypothetical protein